MIRALRKARFARWGLFAFLLAITSSAAQYSPEFKSSELRLAFIDSTSERARTALARHIDDLDGVIGQWLQVDAAGKISEVQDPQQDDGNPFATLKYIRKTRPLIALALVSDDPGGSRAFAHLGDPRFRSRLERQLVTSIKKFDFDGALINFDDPRAADEAGLVRLLSELRVTLAPLGKKIGVVLPADWPVDYSMLSSVADLVVVELYNEGHSDAGPLSPNAWWRRVIQERSQSIPADKLVFAVASMGRDWTPRAPDGSSESVSFSQLMLAAATNHASVEFDKASGNPHVSYRDEGGSWHDAWFLDAATAFNQISSLARMRLKGVALWQLGAEDESLWSVFKGFGSGVDFDTAKLRSVRTDYDMTQVGRGEVYRFLHRSETGRRSVQLDQSGRIIDETYEVLPRPWTIEATGVRPGAVALTFDDGPDPEYTDEILDILKREGVKATFFVVGSQAIKHPGIVRRIVNEGHELGNHTFTHPDLAKVPDFLVRLEIDANERLLQVLTGQSTLLLRPPYASDSIVDTIQDAHVLELASKLGYRTIGANLDPNDWRGIPAREIVERVVRGALAGNGSVIELHDAGGDRSQTVAALPLLIDTLRNRGFRFVRASDLLGSATSALPATGDRWVPVATIGVDGLLLEQRLFLGLFWACLVLGCFRFLLLLTGALVGRRSRGSAPVHTPRSAS